MYDRQVDTIFLFKITRKSIGIQYFTFWYKIKSM